MARTMGILCVLLANWLSYDALNLSLNLKNLIATISKNLPLSDYPSVWKCFKKQGAALNSCRFQALAPKQLPATKASGSGRCSKVSLPFLHLFPGRLLI